MGKQWKQWQALFKLQNHWDGDCSHQIKRCLFPGRKATTNLEYLKSRDITLPTKVHIVKTMVFPVDMYRCESWTIKKAAQFSLVTQSCPTLCEITPKSHWRNNPRKNEAMEPKQKQRPAVDGTGDRRKVRWYKEQYCIGTWNVKSMNQGKFKVVKQEMARMNINILGISKLRWTGIGEI